MAAVATEGTPTKVPPDANGGAALAKTMSASLDKAGRANFKATASKLGWAGA